MSQGAYVKDSQNPYRTGVLVGNHTEDRFGLEIASNPVRPLFFIPSSLIKLVFLY